MMQWLRRSFITGVVVTVPLFVSVAAIVWLFLIVDAFTTPLSERLFGRHVPGVGILVTAVAILLVGAVATNVIGRRFLQRGESLLLRVPVFRTIYAPVKELVAAFSPDNASGFKQVVILEGQKGTTLGFLTKEFTVDRGDGPEAFLAVYGRYSDLRAQPRHLSRHQRRGGHQNFPERRHGAALPRSRGPRRRPLQGLPGIIRRFCQGKLLLARAEARADVRRMR
jgi:Protein of unknown function (DUF502)